MADEETPEPAPPPPEKAPKFLTWLAKRPYFWLALLCLALWTPGVLSLPALDRDESRFAESSRQMLESGNWIDIRFGQVPRYKKPVGIYWAQAATTFAAGHAYGWEPDTRHIWTYRLPSLLGGIAAVWLSFWIGSALGAEIGMLAALLMASTVLLTAEASIATTDAVQLACILGMQGVLLRLYLGPISMRMALWGWASLALGILVKGPVTPAIAAVTIFALMCCDKSPPQDASAEESGGRLARLRRAIVRRIKAFFGRAAWLKGSQPLKGFGLLLAIVLPWLIAIAIQTHGDFFRQSLGDDFAAKVAGGQESHGAWPGYYLLTSTLSFWPAILFVLPGIGLALSRRGEPVVRFLLAWAGATWLMMEAVPTKLPHYVLPAYPALAVMAAMWLLQPKAPPPPAPSILTPTAEDGTALPPPVTKKDWSPWLRRIAALQFLIGLAALCAAPVLMLPRFLGDGDVPWIDGVAAGAALVGLLAWMMFAASLRKTALFWALLAAFVVVPLLTTVIAPRLTQMWMTARLADLVAKDGDINDPPPVLAGYEEPSLVFALGARTNLTDGKGAAEIGARQGGLALIADGERAPFLARLAELQADAAALDDLSGFNYSRGRKVHVTVFRVTALDPTARPQPQ